MAVFTDQKNKLKDKVEELCIERNDISSKIAAVAKYNSEIVKFRQDLDQCETDLQHYNEQIYSCRKDIEKITNLQKTIDQLRKDIKLISQYVHSCIKYGEIISKQGIIFALVDQAIPTIEKFAQDMLTVATSEALSVSIEPYKVLRNKKQVDEIMIYLVDSKGKRDVLEASGAEVVLISLALRAAFSYLLALRTGSKVELFIIDEGFGAFDEFNKINVKKLLNILGESFSKVIFITHVPELKDAAKDVIKIETNGLISKHEIVKGNI
jgi:exonuclease SbcC